MEQLKIQNQRREFSNIPKEWKISKLEDLSIRIMKGIFDLNPVNYVKTGIPFLRISDIKNNTIAITTTKFISEELNKKFPSSELHPDDLVISKVGSVGLSDKIAKIPKSISKCNISQNLIGIKLDNQILHPDHLLSLLQIPSYMSRISSGSNTTTLKSIQLEVLRKLPIILPPLKEQQKIACILSNIDELIRKTDQIIEQTQRLKKGLMQRLLTKGIGHTKFKKTKLGNIPEKWELTKLSDISNKIIDGTHYTPTYIKEGISFLRIVDIQNENIDWNKVKKISFEEHQNLTKRCKPEKGDVLLSKNGTVGITKVVDWDNPFSIFVSLCLIKPMHEKIDSYYLKNILPSDICFKQIKLRSKQGTVTNLHLEEIRELMIPLPPILEQKKIIDVINSINRQLSVLSRNKITVVNIKSGLMQKLLTGKIRVKV